MTDVETKRKAEFIKYERAYKNPKYRMKGARKIDAEFDLVNLPCRGSYLDVSCGQGDMLEIAERIGFAIVQGTEIIPDLIKGSVVYAEAHDLPFEDNSFDVVTMFDVIEHLIPGDDEKACRELARVSKKFILITANNKPSFNKAGDDLHINKRDYDEWDNLFRLWFPGKVTWLKGKRNYVSETWKIELPDEDKTDES